MSARELDPPDHVVYADLSCWECGGFGFIKSDDPKYAGWHWCDCAIVNSKRKIELADDVLAR